MSDEVKRLHSNSLVILEALVCSLMVQQLFCYFLLMLLSCVEETRRRVLSLFHDITPSVVVCAMRVKEFGLARRMPTGEVKLRYGGK